MKLTAVALFGAGYVLGSRAGRERYEQIKELARGAAGRFEESGMRQRLEAYGNQVGTSSAGPGHSRRHRPSDALG